MSNKIVHLQKSTYELLTLIIDAVTGSLDLFISAALAEMASIEFENIKMVLGKQLILCENGKYCEYCSDLWLLPFSFNLISYSYPLFSILCILIYID